MIGTRTKKICLIIILLNFVAVAAYIFLFLEMQAINQNTRNLAAALAETKKQNEALGLLKDALGKTAGDRQKLDSFFVASDGVVNFLDWIEGLANRELTVAVNSVAIENVEPPQNTLEALHLSVGTTGTWQGVFRFLELMETAPYKITINHATLLKTGNGGGGAPGAGGKRAKGIPLDWQGNFDIDIYKLK